MGIDQDHNNHSAGVDPAQFSAFEVALGPSLLEAGVPRSLWEKLFVKLTGQIFDAGSRVQFRFDSANGWSLILNSTIRAEEDIFLVDHAITYPAHSLHEVVNFVRHRDNERCVERLAEIMGISTDENEEGDGGDDDEGVEEMEGESVLDTMEAAEEERGSTMSGAGGDNTEGRGIYHICTLLGDIAFEDFADVSDLDLDSKDLTDEDIMSAELTSYFPGVEQLSLRSNNIKNIATVTHLVSNFPKLKAAWFNNNPVTTITGEDGGEGGYQSLVRAACPEAVEILDSEFTEHYGEWAMLFCAQKDDPTISRVVDIRELDISGRGISFLKYGLFASMPHLETLRVKANPVTLTQLREACSQLQSLKNLEVDDTLAPYSEVLGLFPNLVTLNNMPRNEAFMNDENSGGLAHRVISKVPKFVFSYTVVDASGSARNIFYTMDEVGSRMNHSCNPSFQMVTLFFDGAPYGVMWPVKDSPTQSHVTRDYAASKNTAEEKAAFLRQYMSRCWCGEDSCVLRPQQRT